MSDTKKVYAAISAVTAIMAREGLSKSRTASTGASGSYRFRGIDDIYNALSGHLADVKLNILPRVLERVAVERTNAKGTVMTYVTLTVEFDLVSAEDGSMHTIRTMGEAMDSGDKATNKAMSAAMKYACLLAFQIPTEGDNDIENHHHERHPRSSSLEKSLSESIDFLEWQKLASARLLSAASMGDLQEAWAQAQDEGRRKGAPDAAMKQLAAAKDQMKSKLMPARNGAPA